MGLLYEGCLWASIYETCVGAWESRAINRTVGRDKTVHRKHDCSIRYTPSWCKGKHFGIAEQLDKKSEKAYNTIKSE